MKEIIVIMDRFNYSGSRIEAVVKVNDGELPHVTFDKWASHKAEILQKDKNWAIRSYDFIVQDVQEV